MRVRPGFCGSFSLLVLSSSFAAVMLVGCGIGPAVAPNPAVTLTGKVHGGQQPVSGAHIYLMAAAVSGSVASGNGYGNASVSMLSGTGLSDSVGGYVLTDSNGNFTITGDYNACSVTGASTSSQVYLYATGGSEGAGTNSANGLLAALGTCGNLSSSTYVTINEVSTIAMAYALAGFATDATHISIPEYTTGTTPDTLAATGLANAFVNATLLADTATATAQSTVAASSTTGGTGTVPQTTINTLANILAYCVNTADITPGVTLSAYCTNLLNTATSNGIANPTSGHGTVATNTATAAIYIAQNPGANISTLTGYPNAQSPFTPGLSLSSTPNDLTLGILYTGGGLSAPGGVAVDATGNAWVTNPGSEKLTNISSSGSFLSGTSGYAVRSYANSFPPAIDLSGNVWFTDSGNYLDGYSSTGSSLLNKNLQSYVSSPLNRPGGVAVDASGNVWVSLAGKNQGVLNVTSGGTVTGYACGSNCGSSGIALDGSGNVWIPGRSGLGLVNSSGTSIDQAPYSNSFFEGQDRPAIDSSGNAWVGDYNSGEVIKVTASSSGAAYAGPYNAVDCLINIAIDGGNHVWVVSCDTSNGVVELSSAGSLLSGSSGYQGGGAVHNYGVAIDGSGDVWVANQRFSGNSYSSNVVELIGVATPVVTPIAAGLTAPYTPASMP